MTHTVGGEEEIASISYFLKDQIDNPSKTILMVDGQLFELLHQGVEFLGRQFIEYTASSFIQRLQNERTIFSNDRSRPNAGAH